MDLPLYALLAFAPAGSSIAFAEALEWWTRGKWRYPIRRRVSGPEIRRHPVRVLWGARDPVVGRRPFDGVQRPEMEASLAQRGVTW